MENSIYLGLSKQLALRANMDIIANNIANLNTSGYRGQNLMFEEYLYDQKSRNVEPRAAGDELSFAYNRGQYHTTAAGSLKFTGNPLDVAMEGPGMMGVIGADGEVGYTRAGQMQIAADGTLTNPSGMPVAGQGGGPIVIPDNSTEIIIDDSGIISNQDGQIGQLMMVEFENPQAMEAVGDNMYRGLEEPAEAQNSRIKQGMLEGSNVNGVVEMTRMIETLRTFQSVQNVIQSENERLRSAVQKLTRQ